MHKTLSKTFLGSLLALAAMASAAAAQYQPIPNFTGIGAGYDFRQAINQRFSGATAIEPKVVSYSYAGLPSEQDGDLLWCQDCLRTTPCSGGGAGAWARGSRGQWSCGDNSLEADFNANGHNIVAAASVKTEQPGDAQYRELMVPGNGIKVGNGTAAPFTVVDEGANISGHVNGVINVKAPPYLAKGDGTTDDTAAIQAAINAACASSSNKTEVYLPATPGASYKITSPLLINCALKFTGAGWQQTQMTQSYLGPTIVAQEAETGWKPPLASSVTATWASAHSYAQYWELLDSNGNVEVQTASACTSGSTQPTWPATQGSTVTDNTCTWQVGMIGTQLATGTGSAWDAVTPGFWPGVTGVNNATTEIGNALDLEDYLTGLSHFTVEFYMNPIGTTATGGGTTYYTFGIESADPEQSNLSALQIYLADAQGSCAHNCLGAILNIGGRVALQPTTSAASVSSGATHHIAVTYDGSTATLWLDGVSIKTASVSGNWTFPAYESVMLADRYPQYYPGGSPTTPDLPAYYDSLRISNIARYTANFTPPTAKFTADSNTVLLLNYPTTTATGTMEAFVGTSQTPGYFPIETSEGGADLNFVYIGNMSLADNGIWAAWMLNSTIENINDGPYAGRTCIQLHDNDYQDTIRRAFCQVVPTARTRVGFLFLNASNNNLYDHLQCDGQYTCIEQATGNGTYILPDYTDRGYTIYPFVNVEGQALYDSPTTDIENADTNFKADFYSTLATAPTVVNGGELGMPGGGGPAWFEVSGGKGFTVTGADLLGSTTEVLAVDTPPTSVSTIRDPILTVPSLLTNSGDTYWLRVMQGSRDLGMKFADLPGTVTNGVRRYCVDCDPPANPPVACTSSGTKTGAWIDGLNNTWVCVP
jgi:Concanavalin A-like lectin/glucanases superfamily/Pectate lyase superfamily protein